jgi:tellurite resistance protein TehA-like permease
VHISVFFVGAVAASICAFGAALAFGYSLLGAFGFALLTAVFAQVLYLGTVVVAARDEAKHDTNPQSDAPSVLQEPSDPSKISP